MLVFTLPSFPYVFKVIRDRFAPPKDIDRADGARQVPDGEAARPRRAHGRHARIFAGRAAARALRRRSCCEELQRECASQVEVDGDQLVHRPRLHRAAHAAAQPARRGMPARRRRAAAAQRAARVRQRDQGARRRRHLPRRHAAQELRRHAPRPRGVLRLRRDPADQRGQPSGASRRRRATRKSSPPSPTGASARATSFPSSSTASW